MKAMTFDALLCACIVCSASCGNDPSEESPPEAPAEAPLAAANAASISGAPVQKAPETTPSAAVPVAATAPSAGPALARPTVGPLPSIPSDVPSEVSLGGRWDLPRGPDGRELTREERRALAEARLERMQADHRELIRLSVSTSPADVAALLERITGPHPARDKIDAIFQLGEARREAFVPALTALLGDKDALVRAEAAIRLYRWGERSLAMPHLKELSRLGVIVSRAFFETWKNGRFTFSEGAADFFQHALSSPTVEVRVDAAAGLLDLRVPHDDALRVLRAVVFEAYRWDERLLAVSRLEVLRHLPGVRAIVEQAQRDPDERVAARAREILQKETTR